MADIFTDSSILYLDNPHIVTLSSVEHSERLIIFIVVKYFVRGNEPVNEY